ncbi:hypothetical protein SKAU_G00213240 [Synaphobranchus kaupii]|uniref:Uncharacterized protein n=1 Tax=Synaphobranchus kaupii TaxID=118154 RepID=A0A9Q1F9H7_SYNKA|nr:hypothetical protein SKAU_G00213240 [Synaphobranchus kaupii]
MDMSAGDNGDHASYRGSKGPLTAGKPEDPSSLGASPSVIRPEVSAFSRLIVTRPGIPELLPRSGLVINLGRTRVIRGSTPLRRPDGPPPTRTAQRDRPLSFHPQVESLIPSEGPSQVDSDPMFPLPCHHTPCPSSGSHCHLRYEWGAFVWSEREDTDVRIGAGKGVTGVPGEGRSRALGVTPALGLPSHCSTEQGFQPRGLAALRMILGTPLFLIAPG